MQTVVETPSYLADADRLFSPDERMAIVERLANEPTCGVVIPGSGGLQGEVRLRRAGQERWCANNLPVQRREPAGVHLAVFAKNEKANLSPAERNALAKIVTVMIENYRRQK